MAPLKSWTPFTTAEYTFNSELSKEFSNFEEAVKYYNWIAQTDYVENYLFKWENEAKRAHGDLDFHAESVLKEGSSRERPAEAEMHECIRAYFAL